MSTTDTMATGMSRRSFLKSTAGVSIAFAGSSLGFAGLGMAQETVLRAYGVTTCLLYTSRCV